MCATFYPWKFKTKRNFQQLFIMDLIMIIILSGKSEQKNLKNNLLKTYTLTVPIEKEVTRINKNGEKLHKIYLTDYNLLISQNL